jgi:TonB family protein
MMARVLLWLALAAGLCHAQAAPPAPAPTASAAWERFTYPREEFSAEWPGMPYVYHTERLIRQMPYDTETVRHYGLYSEGAVMMVTSYDNPRRHETLKHLTGEFRKWHGSAIGDKPAGEATAGGRRGFELRFIAPLHGAARLFLTERHAYFVRAFAREENHPAVARFLDSFALTAAITPVTIIRDEPLPAALSRWPPPGRAGAGQGGEAGGAGEPAAAPAGVRPEGGPPQPRDVARKAVLVFKPEPGFSPEALANNTVGMVRLRAVLSSDGRVKNISVVKGLPHGLTERAVAAARAVMFFPAVKDGRPVSQWVTFEYNYNVR